MPTQILKAPILLLFFLGGCTTIQVTESSIVDEKIGKIPDIGITTASPVGGVMYSQFKYWSKTGYRIRNGFSSSLGLGRVSVADGDFVAKAIVDGGTVYCTEKAAYIDLLVGPFKPACFIDKNEDNKFEKFKAQPGMVWFEKEIIPQLPYEKSEQITPRTDSFKYELLYQGLSSSTLKLSYREYINDFARPAFFQDITYDLTTKPTTITFRTVKIEVLNADNNKIDYRILSGF